MNPHERILANSTEVFEFLKTRFPVFHLSNIFFRDVHYGIMTFLKEKKIKVKYPAAEKIATALMEKLERERVVRRIDHQTWAVHYDKFKTPVVKLPAAPPKPAAAPATATTA